MKHHLQRGARRASWLVGWVLCLAGMSPLHSQEVQPVFSGTPMSMNFQNIEVRTALQIVADFTGFNIIIGTDASVVPDLTGVIACTIVLSVFAHGLSAGPLSTRYGRWVTSHHPPIEREPGVAPTASRGRVS